MIDRPYLAFATHAPGLVKVATRPLAHSSFAATVAAPPPLPLRHADAHEVLRLVAVAFGLTVDDLLAAQRHKTTVEARQVASWLLRAETSMSFPELGRLLRRDHTTVMSNVRRCERQRAFDSVFRVFTDELVVAIRARVGGKAA